VGTVCFLDTSIATFNHGDDIIMRSIYCELYDLLKNNFRLNFGTHTCNYTRDMIDLGKLREAKAADYKFICGTDLLGDRTYRQLNNGTLQFSIINPTDAEIYRNSILLGVGCKNPERPEPDEATYHLYNSLLSKEYIHSVRDNIALQLAKNSGLNAINTGCPTLWMLTEEHCKKIPSRKSNTVVISLNTEKKNYERDKDFLKIVMNNYKKVFFWVQRIHDDDYFKSLVDDWAEVTFIYDLVDYEKVLANDVDYVGIRLHGGIFAMQHKRRTIIVGIDHRSEEMKKDNNIPYIGISEIDSLEHMINSSFETKISLNWSGIEIFKRQFNL